MMHNHHISCTRPGQSTRASASPPWVRQHACSSGPLLRGHVMATRAPPHQAPELLEEHKPRPSGVEASEQKRQAQSSAGLSRAQIPVDLEEPSSASAWSWLFVERGALLGVRASASGTIGPAAQGEDLWLAWDKLGHLVSCAALTLLALWFLALWRGPPATSSDRLLQATIIAFALGAFKEVGDFARWWPGELSTKDLVADAAGCSFAVLLVLLWRKCVGDAAAADSLLTWPQPAGGKRSRLVDLELGLVYGQQLRRAIIKGASDLPWLQRLTSPGKSEKAGRP